ncbi:MAG: hypothetical protein LBP83_05160 [Dysgonamonadaceae bacterium]|jgi:hypothetical protein|nr:hypothetical protein [Dysgonamonadaceae bacterium]
MKTLLLIQIIAFVLLSASAAGMAAAAFIYDSVLLWKAFTIIILAGNIFLVRESCRELKDYLKKNNHENKKTF